MSRIDLSKDTLKEVHRRIEAIATVSRTFNVVVPIEVWKKLSLAYGAPISDRDINNILEAIADGRATVRLK